MTTPAAVQQSLSEITSFIGTEIGDPTSDLAEKPPKAAKHVATVSWSWSPVHSRTSKYRIATDENRAGWHLFETSQDFDSGKNISSRVASGYPYEGVTAREAARILLKAAWTSEVEQWEFDPSGADVERSGLLADGEIEEIADAIAWQRSSTWLEQQSEKSLAALREEWQGPLNDQTIEVADELESCASDLGLPQDFLELCAHYDVEPPNLLVLACKLVAEAAVFRQQKEEQAQTNRIRFQKEIDILVSNLSTTTGRGGGMAIPSVQSRVRQFLNRYVGENGELPTGKHRVGLSPQPFDFDELRTKYRL